MTIHKVDNLTIRKASFAHADGKGHTNVTICDELKIARFIHVRPDGAPSVDEKGTQWQVMKTEHDIEMPLDKFLEALGVTLNAA